MAVYAHEPLRLEPSKRAMITVVVILLHLLLLYLFSLMKAAYPVPPPTWPVMNIELFRSGGSGAAARVKTSPDVSAVDPAVPSAIHVPEVVEPWPDTPVAPDVPAEQQLVLESGDAPEVVSPAPAVDVSAVGTNGAGGASGGGVGTGTGSGVGPGSGRGGASGAILVRAPRGAIMSQNVSPAELAAKPGAWVVFRCRVQATQRLDSCRVLAQSPADARVRQRAEQRLAEVRFQPATRSGRYVSSRVTMAIAFPPDA